MKGVRRDYIVEQIETGHKHLIRTLHAVADFVGRPYSTVQFRYRHKQSVNGYWIYLPEDSELPRVTMSTDKPRNFDQTKKRANESNMKFLSRVCTRMSTRAIAKEIGVTTNEVERMYEWLLKYQRCGGKAQHLNMVRSAADAVRLLSKLQDREALEGHRRRPEQMGQ